MKTKLLLALFFLFSLTGNAQFFFEGFENTAGPDALPSTNWTLGSGHWAVFDNGVGTAKRWGISNSVSPTPQVYAGANAAYMRNENIGQGNTSRDYLATPAVTVPANGQLHFFTRSFTSGNQGTLYKIMVVPAINLANQTNPGAYAAIQQWTEPTLTSAFDIYEEKVVDLSAYAGQQLFIAFVHEQTQPTTALGGDRWLVDNVSITAPESATCPTPTNATVTYNSQTSVTLNWTETGAATQWEVLAQPFGNPLPDVTTSGISTSSTSYTFTGLNGLAYVFYIRAICSPTDVSYWLPVTYILPACQVPTNVSVSGITPFTATVSWLAPGDSQFQVLVLPTGESAPTASTPGGTIISTPSYSITGLDPATTYDVYIRTVCNNVSSVTEWSIPVTFTTPISLGPIVTNNNYTPTQLVQDVLLDNNPCVTVSNITSSTGTDFGSVNGLGYFVNTNSTFPLSSGIVLSTGNVANIPGPNTTLLQDNSTNWPGDTQLTNYINALGIDPGLTSYYNASKLEFDFTSLNEFMSFNFLFASEEYGTFQCSYSDAFAFFLTDLDTGTTTNLALVPGTTTPIAVTTIRDNANNAACTSENAGYFGQFNGGNNASSSATNFNGQTKVMTASSAIVPNHNYHIKLVVADRNDGVYDSAIFIEAGSFTVGPPVCNDKVQLVAFIDTNNNGIKDINEVNFIYGSFVMQQNNTGPITNVSTPFGTYTIYDSTATTYDFSYAINSELSAFYSATVVNYNDINITANPNQVLYFPITLTQGFNDVSVAIVTTSAPRPGFNHRNKIVYKNLGITPASGTITFVKSPLTTITYISEPLATPNTEGFTYSFTNLAPYETRSIYVYMSVPAIPTVNLGDFLTTSVTIAPSTTDINVNNNAFSNTQLVVASYDPNDKMESHGGKIQFNQFSPNDYLYYTIRFQNTGTANAIDVKLIDDLDSKLDETSIRMVDASHDYVLERVNNQLIWKFNYIHLVGALENEELSKGYVTFKIKLKPGFAVGDIIPNKARIFFDTNPAIITNTFNTEFVTTLSNASFTANDIVLYPNPAHHTVYINLQHTTDMMESIRVYDILGKTIALVPHLSTNQTSLDTSSFSKGVYMVEITSEHHVKQIKKLVIQ